MVKTQKKCFPHARHLSAHIQDCFKNHLGAASSINCLEADDMAHQRMMEYWFFIWVMNCLRSEIIGYCWAIYALMIQESWVTCLMSAGKHALHSEIYTRSLHTQEYFLIYVIYRVGKFIWKVMLNLSRCRFTSQSHIWHFICFS